MARGYHAVIIVVCCQPCEACGVKFDYYPLYQSLAVCVFSQVDHVVMMCIVNDRLRRPLKKPFLPLNDLSTLKNFAKWGVVRPDPIVLKASIDSSSNNAQT